MVKAFLSDAAKQALTDAVHFVEMRSSAELVVAVRARSGSYLHADLIAGILAALASLIGLLFSPWPFELIWFVVDPLLVGPPGSPPPPGRVAGVPPALASRIGLLFSPWPFELIWFVVDPLLVGLLAGFAASRLPAAPRALPLRPPRRRSA